MNIEYQQYREIRDLEDKILTLEKQISDSNERQIKNIESRLAVNLKLSSELVEFSNFLATDDKHKILDLIVMITSEIDMLYDDLFLLQSNQRDSQSSNTIGLFK